MAQEHDFENVPDPEDYKSIPPGEYTVRVADVRVGVTRDGAERWGMRFEVTDGEYAGRTAAWDGLVWSARALPRVKHVLACMGFDTGGRLALEPEDLIGREVHVVLVEEERTDAESGRTVSRLRVPYLGYERAANGVRTPF